MADEGTSTGQEAREQLGWLATSAVPARKRRHIEGVSSSSIVQLQAQLYRTQDHARLRQDGIIDAADKHVRRKQGDPFAASNPGVAERAAKDKLQIKGTAADPDREQEVRAALERKAQLYEKLARGDVEDEQEAFEVDFFRKGHSLEHEERLLSSQAAGGSGRERSWSPPGPGDMRSRDMDREQQRQQWESEERTRVAAEAAELDRRAARKQAIKDLTAETAEGRERAAAQKHKKEAQLTAKRERLKAAFIQKQLEAKRAALAAAAAKKKGGSGC